MSFIPAKIAQNFMRPAVHALCDKLMASGFDDYQILNYVSKHSELGSPSLHDIQCHREIFNLNNNPDRQMTLRGLI